LPEPSLALRFVAMVRITASLLVIALLAGCQSERAQNQVQRAETQEAVARSTQTNRPAAPVTAEPVGKGSLSEFQKRAAGFNGLISLPPLETSPEALQRSVSNAISTANAALDKVGALAPEQVNFDNTIRALDDIAYEAGLTGNRVGLLKETSTNAEVRDAATESTKVLSEWAVGLDYREDVYKAVRAFADKNPSLEGEKAKLLKEVLRDYRRAGLELPKGERQEVEKMRKELSRLTTDFDTHITQAKKPVKYTRAELEGVPDSFLEQIKTNDDFIVMANITFHYINVIDNAKREETRRKLVIAHDTLAIEENRPLLQQILELRDRIAKKLGYATWADFAIEPKMAKNARTATSFLENLKRGLNPKFQAELKQFQEMKARDTSNPDAKIEVWDWRYYNNQLKKEKYTVDSEALRVFFPYERVLNGMFSIYQRIFGITIERVEAPYKWIDDLQLYAVSDAKTKEPLGLFYLDMFPRDGKYNHFAQFGIIEGKRLRNGKYQRPTVALICNFPTPQPGKPSLLSHQDVETLFHEFGHAMHSILTRADFARFSGTAVPRDFVEAPSQMLEYWIWDKSVLDSFAADYRDPSKKIPQEVLAQLKTAKLATEGTRYRRQISYALMDLALHTKVREGVDAIKVANDALSDAFLRVPEGTALVTYFGHVTGYDAAYYGYAWADAIAADMATVFENAAEGFFDTRAGARLRKEIYEPGDSRDVNISIEKFLGRPRSIEPFLRTIGIGPPVQATSAK
jgi:thimet oligopeptidase